MRKVVHGLAIWCICWNASFGFAADEVDVVGLETADPKLTLSALEPASETEGTQVEELQEVEIIGERPRGRRDIATWLRRLPGKYISEGMLYYIGGQTVTAKGTTICTGFGKGPGVQCVMTLQVPTDDTHLNPGVMLFGIDIEKPWVRYMSVDDTGIGVGGSSELRGETVKFQTKCIATMARECVTTTWFSAPPRSDKLYYRVDIAVNGNVTARFEITKTRVQ